MTTDNASYISIDQQNPWLFYKSFGKMAQTAVLPHLILTHAFLGQGHFKEIACLFAPKLTESCHKFETQQELASLVCHHPNAGRWGVLMVTQRASVKGTLFNIFCFSSNLQSPHLSQLQSTNLLLSKINTIKIATAVQLFFLGTKFLIVRFVTENTFCGVYTFPLKTHPAAPLSSFCWYFVTSSQILLTHLQSPMIVLVPLCSKTHCCRVRFMGNSKMEQKRLIEKKKTGYETNIFRKQGVAKNRYLRVLSRAGTTQDRELAKV